MKRPGMVGNPFVKRKNRTWEVDTSIPLQRPNSQPSIQANTKCQNEESKSDQNESGKFLESTLLSAAIEAGEAVITDHLTYFTTKLSSHANPFTIQPNLPISKFVDLYKRNQHPGGHHFVVHQHDHPLAGLHYDLRLQISKTSSISFAIMYGLPGNPNSKRLNRNSTETRVHNLWNHLVETASHQTGSMLIWDIGEYEILDRIGKHIPKYDPASDSDSDSDTSTTSSPNEEMDTPLTEPQKLHAAFQARKIKLRLHGTRLPTNYTLSLRLTTTENRTEQPKKPSRKRRRMAPPRSSSGAKKDSIETPSSSDGELEIEAEKGMSTDNEDEDDKTVTSQPQNLPPGKENSIPSSALEKELQELEDEKVRKTNAYPGATNTINSIYQRKWYLSIDRIPSGFCKVSGKSPAEWKRNGQDGFEAFFVKGREVERSVVTGRTAEEVMRDEGVGGFVGRKGWRAVLE